MSGIQHRIVWGLPTASWALLLIFPRGETVSKAPANLIESLPRSRYIEFFLLIAASLIIWYQPCLTTVKLALSSDAYTHILLIVPVSLAFAYFDRNSVHTQFSGRPWHSYVALMLAVAMRSISALHVLPLGEWWNMLALVIWWIGVVVFCFGAKTFQSFFFPLCFLFLIIPLPESVVNWLTDFLQHKSAVAASILFNLAGVPVSRQDIVLSIPGLDIEVARECSSIRSSTILVVITVVLAQLFLLTPWRKALLVLLAIPLSIAKNAIRIFVIAELGTKVDPGYLHGKLHHDGGVIFLVLALVVVILLLWVLRTTERPTQVRAAARI
jgi:exosortase